MGRVYEINNKTGVINNNLGDLKTRIRHDMFCVINSDVFKTDLLSVDSWSYKKYTIDISKNIKAKMPEYATHYNILSANAMLAWTSGNNPFIVTCSSCDPSAGYNVSTINVGITTYNPGPIGSMNAAMRISCLVVYYSD